MAHSELIQTSKIELFTRIAFDCFCKNLHLRCLIRFWIRVWDNLFIVTLTWLYFLMKKIKCHQNILLFPIMSPCLKFNGSFGLTFIKCMIWGVETDYFRHRQCVLSCIYEALCAIWYHRLYNFKKVKNTHGGVLLLLKVTLLHGCSSRF